MLGRHSPTMQLSALHIPRNYYKYAKKWGCCCCWEHPLRFLLGRQNRRISFYFYPTHGDNNLCRALLPASLGDLSHDKEACRHPRVHSVIWSGFFCVRRKQSNHRQRGYHYLTDAVAAWDWLVERNQSLSGKDARRLNFHLHVDSIIARNLTGLNEFVSGQSRNIIIIAGQSQQSDSGFPIDAVLF